MARAEAAAAVAADTMGDPMDQGPMDHRAQGGEHDRPPRHRTATGTRPPIPTERRRSLDMSAVLALGQVVAGPRRKGKEGKSMPRPPPLWDDGDVGVADIDCGDGGTTFTKPLSLSPSPPPRTSRTPRSSQPLAYDDHDYDPASSRTYAEEGEDGSGNNVATAATSATAAQDRAHSPTPRTATSRQRDADDRKKYISPWDQTNDDQDSPLYEVLPERSNSRSASIDDVDQAIEKEMAALRRLKAKREAAAARGNGGHTGTELKYATVAWAGGWVGQEVFPTALTFILFLYASRQPGFHAASLFRTCHNRPGLWLVWRVLSVGWGFTLFVTHCVLTGLMPARSAIRSRTQRHRP